MNENDTILLLRECDSGLKMAISSLDEVLDVIKNKHFKNQCIESKNKHQTLKKEIDQLLKENNIKAKAVYLSLGDREEKTRNPVMATVGHAIRSVHETISDSGINTILEWNQGNHFKDVDIRMAKALTWSIRATVHG